MTTNEYVPGVCNIGAAEIRTRRNSGLVTLAVTIVALVLFLVLPIAAPWRLLLALPAAAAAVGFLQAGMHFCAGFAMRGVFNFGNDTHHTDTIEQAEYRRADQKKALLIFGLSLLIGIVFALLTLLLP
jgi:fatty acid desaturase